MATDDLKARIAAIRGQDHVRGCDGRKYSCDCGYEGDVDNALTEAADRIAALEAQLAARDAEIAVWLRGEAARVSDSAALAFARKEQYARIRIAGSLGRAADAIERGDYRKDEA